MTQPVRYEASAETVEPDEAETIRGLKEQFKIFAGGLAVARMAAAFGTV